MPSEILQEKIEALKYTQIYNEALQSYILAMLKKINQRWKIKSKGLNTSFDLESNKRDRAIAPPLFIIKKEIFNLLQLPTETNFKKRFF